MACFEDVPVAGRYDSLLIGCDLCQGISVPSIQTIWRQPDVCPVSSTGPCSIGESGCLMRGSFETRMANYLVRRGRQAAAIEKAMSVTIDYNCQLNLITIRNILKVNDGML